jgi:hypothetical protein
LDHLHQLHHAFQWLFPWKQNPKRQRGDSEATRQQVVSYELYAPHHPL